MTTEEFVLYLAHLIQVHKKHFHSPPRKLIMSDTTRALLWRAKSDTARMLYRINAEVVGAVTLDTFCNVPIKPDYLLEPYDRVKLGLGQVILVNDIKEHIWTKENTLP